MKFIQNISIFFSYGCLIHCILLPILVIVFPFLGAGFIDHRQLDMITVPAILITGLNLCWQIFKRHHTKMHFLLLLAWLPVLIFFLSPSSSVENNHMLYHLIIILPILALSLYHLYPSRKCSICSEKNESTELNQT